MSPEPIYPALGRCLRHRYCLSPCHRRRANHTLFSVVMVLFVLLPSLAWSQTSVGRNRATATLGGAASPEVGGENRVTLVRSVEPAFHIEPIVQRFKARRGEIIPFKFELASLGKVMNVKVRPVCLRQEESGVILHDLKAEATNDLVISSPTEFHLQAGEAQVIRGQLHVPAARTNYLSYGILVVDNGQLTNEPDAKRQGNIEASVRFVTQYVLRIDVETGSKDLSEMNRLELVDGGVTEVLGMPMATVFLNNPTNFAFECTVTGSTKSTGGTQSRPFPFGMQSRATAPLDERYMIRIMPQGRIRLQASVESALSPGEQTMELRLSNGRRTLVTKEFRLQTDPNTFPAMDSQIAYLGDLITVQPSQLSLGLTADSNRTCNLVFENNSDVDQTVQLEAMDLNGKPLKGLRLTDKPIELRPGRSKTVRSIIESDGGDKAVIGLVRVTTTSERSGTRKNDLPMELLFGERPPTKIVFGQLEAIDIASSSKTGLQEFRLSVTNRGDGYTPIHAVLKITATSGQSFTLADGFGKWIAPGESRQLRFVSKHQFEPGQYQLELSKFTDPNGEPSVSTLNVNLPIEPKQAVRSQP